MFVGTDPHVIEVTGELDLYSAPELQEMTARAIDAGSKDLIVDLSHVTFIDSTGLGILVSTLNRIRRMSGTLALIVSDYDVERLLELSGLHGTFTIYRSREEALSHA